MGTPDWWVRSKGREGDENLPTNFSITIPARLPLHPIEISESTHVGVVWRWRKPRLCEEEAEEHRGLGYKLPFKYVASEDDGENDDDGKEREEAEEAEEVGAVGERGDGREGVGKAEEEREAEAENIVDEIIKEGVCDGRVGLLGRSDSEDENCFVETRTLEESRCLNNRPSLTASSHVKHWNLMPMWSRICHALKTSMTDRIVLGYPKRWAAVSTGK
jgi:hypothetical protein